MTSPYFYFNPAKLDALGKESAQTYRTAEPFPHIVFDNFLPEWTLEQVLSEFPSPTGIAWNQYTDIETQNKKLSNENENLIGPFTRHLLAAFNSSTFLSFLEQMTGIEKLIPDPHFRGGGLHQTLPGGHLSVHIDFNKYKRLDLYRRLNILIYLNKDWKPEWGGALELWSKDGKECIKKINPIFNRIALFTTSEGSHHGHPHPLAAPEGVTRKSLALYYYTVRGSADISTEPHTTLFPHAKKKRRSLRETLGALLPVVIKDFYKSFKG